MLHRSDPRDPSEVMSGIKISRLTAEQEQRLAKLAIEHGKTDSQVRLIRFAIENCMNSHMLPRIEMGLGKSYRGGRGYGPADRNPGPVTPIDSYT